jgi:hypothetical protein
MAKITKTKNIDGVEVTLSSIGFFKQKDFIRKVFKPLMKLAKDNLSDDKEVSLESFFSEIANKDVPLSKILSFIEQIEETVSDELIEYISETALIGGVVEGNSINSVDDIDSIFSGSTLLFWKSVFFFVELSFGDFFSLLSNSEKK